MEQNGRSKENGIEHAASKPEQSREESVPVSIGEKRGSWHAPAALAGTGSLSESTVSYEKDKVLPLKPRLTESTRRAEHMDTTRGCESRDRRSANVREASLSPPVRTDTVPLDDPLNEQASNYKKKIDRAVTEEEHILVLKKAILKRIIQVRECNGTPQNLRRLEAAFELLLEGRTEDVMRCLGGKDMEDSKEPFPRH
jgi:hypothetical protein